VGVDIALPEITRTQGRRAAQCDWWDTQPY
jgi:hypothetical protein